MKLTGFAKFFGLALYPLAVMAAAEPAPRPVAGQVVKLVPPLPNISGVTELADGRLLISDHKTPRVAIVDPKTGVATTIGGPGAGAGQYVRPGGFYGAPGSQGWLIDRGRTRAIKVSPAGTLDESLSMLPRGSSGSSDADYDSQQLDSRGHAYYLKRDGLRGMLDGGAAAAKADLVRFDPTTQQTHVVAQLLQPISKSTPGGDGMVFSRSMIGSPADGFGVAPDGRVAVVRAVPYRVDWYSATGVETKGPTYPVDVLPMTEADKQAFIAANSGHSVSVSASASQGAGRGAGPGPLFAETKAPFDPLYVAVSPNGRVFVRRTTALQDTRVIYDVFDGRGQRVDRVALPAGSRVVGFGSRSVYVREAAGAASFLLKSYEFK